LLVVRIEGADHGLRPSNDQIHQGREARRTGPRRAQEVCRRRTWRSGIRGYCPAGAAASNRYSLLSATSRWENRTTQDQW